jgi:integrase
VRLAILTGLTQAEQFRLRWTDIQFDRSILTVVSGTTGIPSEVGLVTEAVELLRGLRAQSDSRWVFPDPQHPQRPIDTHQFYTREWPRAIKKAGLPRVAWKDLRHTCGRRLAEAGWSTQAITGFLRHYGKKRVLIYQAWNPARAAATIPTRQPAMRPEVSASLAALQAVIREKRGDQPLTFGQLAQFYAVHHLKERPSRSIFDRMYQQYWADWADRSCLSIGKRDVTAWYIGLGQTPAHANKALTFLRAVYNWSMRMGLLDEMYNPAVRIDRYFRPTRERYLTESELITVQAALPTLPPKYKAYFLTLLLTGSRLSEARCMRWKDLEVISTGGPGGPTHLWKKPRTKNGHSHTVPLPRQLVEAIYCLPQEQAYVFPGAPGHPLSRASVNEMWQTIRRRVGLDDVTVHDLRRTVGSYLSQRGENAQTVQQVLNHRSLQQTAIYTRMGSSSIHRALAAQADWMQGLLHGSEPGPDESGPMALVPASPPPITPLGGKEEWPG